MDDDLITLAEAAEMLSVSTMTLRRMIQSGELKAFKRVGVRSLLVSRAKVEALKRPRPVDIRGANKNKRG